jgi:hypothetical protein
LVSTSAIRDGFCYFQQDAGRVGTAVAQDAGKYIDQIGLAELPCRDID